MKHLEAPEILFWAAQGRWNLAYRGYGNLLVVTRDAETDDVWHSLDKMVLQKRWKPIRIERKARDLLKQGAHFMSQTRVLSLSSDPVILETGDLILRSAGHIVVSTTSIKEAAHLFQDGDFDLIILCHTLPAKDCECLTSFIRASGSRIPIASGLETFGEFNASAEAALAKDPVAFLAGVRDLLTRHIQMQPTGDPLPLNNREAASVNRSPRRGWTL
jgi:CheY-like chemotaxis protein